MIADNQQGKSVARSFAYLAGVYVTDGCVYQGKYGVPRFTVEVIDRDFIDNTLFAIGNTSEVEFNRSIYTRQMGGKTTYSCSVGIRELSSFLVESTNCKQVVPDFVKNDRDLFLSFLAGAMDGDGWISMRKNSMTPLARFAQIAISAKITKYRYLSDIVSCLDRFGFKYSYKEKEDSKYGGVQATINFNKRSFIECGGAFTLSRKRERLNRLSELYGFPQRLEWRPLIGG